VASILELTDSNFDSEMIKVDRTAVAFFYYPGDTPCSVVAPTIQQLADEYSGSVVFGQYDCKANSTAAQNYAIKAYPVVLYFKSTQQKGRTLGVCAQTVYEKAIDNL